MRIYKELNRDYTVVSNEVLKSGLSLKAIGLYFHILSKPDGWNFSIQGISSQVKEGRDATKAAIDELERAGFLRREQKRRKGKYRTNKWFISDKPMTGKPLTEKPLTDKPLTDKPLTDKPLTDKPLTDKPLTENPLQVNTKEVSNKEVSNIKEKEKEKKEKINPEKVKLDKEDPSPVEKEKGGSSNETQDCRNALIACEYSDLWKIAMDLRISLKAVREKHKQIMEMIESGEFQRRYKKHKTVYFTLRKWLNMDKTRGYLQELGEIGMLDLKSESPEEKEKEKRGMERIRKQYPQFFKDEK